MTLGARCAFLCVAAALALSPTGASAHSSEFILAKVSPGNGVVELEMTADYGGNPMIGSENEAREVLGNLLRVRVGPKTRELGALAPVRFEKRTHFDPSAPIPHDPIADAEPHQLMCAIWSWKTSAEKLVFELPQNAGQSVILWTQEKTPDSKPKWVFMVSGDVSPKIAIPQRPPIWGMAVIALVVLGMATPLAWRARRMRRERSFSSRDEG